MPSKPNLVAVPGHRATYILEFGVWRATCRICGFAVTDRHRRQAAAQFRMHIREARIIDLTNGEDKTTVDLRKAESLDSVVRHVLPVDAANAREAN